MNRIIFWNYFLKFSFILAISISSCREDSNKINSDFDMFHCGFNNQFKVCNELNKAYILIEKNLDYDSAFEIINNGLSNALVNIDYESMAKYYSYYFILPELAQSRNESGEFAKEAGNLLFRELEFNNKWNLTYALFNYYNNIRDGDNCLIYAIKLKKLSDENGSEFSKAIAFMAIGVSYKISGNYKNAASNLFNGLYFAEVASKTSIKKQLLFVISEFYRENLMFEQALEYKKRELGLYSLGSALDSLDLFHSELYFHDYISRYHFQLGIDTNRIFEIIDFSIQNNLKRLHLYASSFYRSRLTDTDKLTELHRYYTYRGKDELSSLKENYPFIYHRILASINEVESNYEEAEQNFIKSLKLTSETNLNTESARLARYSIAYGNFLKRLNDKEKAINVFAAAYNYSNKISKEEYKREIIYEASQNLYNLYSQKAKFEDANKFLNIFYENQTKIVASAMDQTIHQMEIDSELRIQQEREKKAYEKKKTIQQSQYNLIAIFLVAFFLLFLMIVQLKIPIWLIKVLGFISIIFIFEFVIIILDNTFAKPFSDHPWRLFAVKVIIISILLPLHHYVEHKIVHYIIKRRVHNLPLISFDFSIFKKWFNSYNSAD
jgi:hypothetical protein